MTKQAELATKEAEYLLSEINALQANINMIDDEGSLLSQQLHAQRRSLESERDAVLNAICQYCEGEGEVLDRSAINPTTIDEPYKTCPMCGGRGVI